MTIYETGKDNPKKFKYIKALKLLWVFVFVSVP